MGVCSEMLGVWNLQPWKWGYSLQVLLIVKNCVHSLFSWPFIVWLWCFALDISNTKHFAYLHPDRLIALLADDRLKVHNELEVFNAAVYWMDHCRPERLPLAPVILQCAVRLLCISPECLIKKVEAVTWIFEIPECCAVLNDAIRWAFTVTSTLKVTSE